ncbi:hypothetical protein [Nocardia fusca]|uniref:hypothetical protein n=1 Tax=Nocardia fusca TaxID=941183 RepID=UPI0012F52004|nr:hypothetical protein [Nocardia fusca]
MFEVSRLVALPEGFPLGVCEAVLGPFPRGNPEALRAGGDAWERAARRCRSEAEELAGVASSVPGCLSGDAAVEAQRVLDGSADRKRDLAVFCASKVVECRETANAIELGQFTWIVMGSALVVELLASLAMPVGGMAAAAGARAAARKGWQLAWAQLIESVIALCARLSASRAALVGQGIVVGGVFAGGVTWGGQVWQQHRGDRDTIDWETVTVSGAGGAAGGVGAGVLYTRPVAGALARLQAAGTRGANAVAMLLAGGAAGVAGGATGTLGGAVAASAYSGDLAMPDGSEFYLGAVSGALEGLLSGGVHTLGHSATPPPPPAGLFGRPARSPKPSDLAAIFARDMNARASGPSGRADLPGITAAGSAHPSSRPGDRPPAAPVSSVKPGANSVVEAAGTATDPDPDPAAASTEHLPPSDRSASNPSPDLTAPGVPAVAGTTAYTGIDSQPGPITHGAPADHSDTVPRCSTGPAADEDDASAITAVPASHGPATTPTALVTDWATHTTGNAAATERSTASTPPDPPVETSATPFSSGAHNRPEPQPNIPWTRTTEYSTPPRLPTPEHTPSPWQAQRNLPLEPGPSAPPTSTVTHPPTATATPTGAPSPHLPPGTIRNTPARTGHPSAPHNLTSTPDNPPHQAIDTPITTPPHLAGPGHPPGPIPYPAVLTGFGSSTDGDHAGPAAVTPDGSRLLPDVGSSAGLLGVPGSDDWTSLDPEGVAVELRRQLLETTGSDIPVLGFDPDSVDPEVAREYARVVVDNFAGAPHVVLDSIEIGPIDDGKPELVPAEVQYRPVTAADGAVRFTRHLVLDQLFAADPGKIRRLVEANAELHHFADSARIRPLYAVISHDFGHLLDRTGKTSARELADNAITRSAWQRSLWARAALRLEVLLARDVLTTTIRDSAAPGSGARLLTDQVAYLPGTPDRIVVAAFVNGHAGALDAARRDPDVAAILERSDIETEYRRLDSYVDRYGGGDRYGVRATIDSAGVVRAEIRTGDNTPQGVDMFSDVLRNLGHLATEFRVEAIAADAIADDLPGHHGDGTPTPLVTRDGAVDTAISRLAAQHGFTRIDGWGESAGQPGGRRSTAVRFLRPEEPGAVDAEPVAGPERTMVLPDDSNARRPGAAPAGPANPAGERDDGDPVSGQAPPRVRGTRDIDEPPVARREGEAGAPIPRESPAADKRGWRQRRVQDESELARVLYHRPETRQAVIAVIDRLRVVLSGLHPQATREQIDNAFYTPEETISGGMVLRSVPLDELRRDGNLRELMAAVQNAMWRNRDIPHPSGTTLDDGLARLLNRPDWAEQAERLGLKVDALARVRASITGGDPSAVIAAQELRFVRHAMSDPGQHAISEEIIHSGAIRGPRDTLEQRRRSLTVQDWSLLGMPLSIRELEAIPGGLVALRKTRLDPHGLLPRDNRGRVDVTALETQLAAEDRAFRHALPLYRYDERGRRVRDESGHAVVDGILVYHEEGTVDAATALRLDPHRFAVPLPWSPGAVRFEFDKHGEWFRRTAVERGVPAGSGVSGTAARIASRFNWIMPHSVPKQDFAGAILALLLPLHHSLYETVRGMQMVGTSVVDPAVFRASDSMVADLYRAVFDRFGISAPDESSGKQITELIGISEATGSPSANTPDATTEPAPPDPGEPG